MPERDRRVFVPKGTMVKLFLEGGSTLDIKHSSYTNSFKLEQKSPNPREAQREQLKATYLSTLYPYVRARLEQHGYEIVGGGEQMSAELTTIETETKLKEWIQNAKSLGISNQEVIKETNDALKQIMIGSPREGETSSLVKSIGTEVSNLVNEAWGIKRPKKSPK